MPKVTSGSMCCSASNSAEPRAGAAAFEEVAEDGFTGLRTAAAEEFADAGDGPPAPCHAVGLM